jgi:signal transduction histidine kinase
MHARTAPMITNPIIPAFVPAAIPPLGCLALLLFLTAVICLLLWRLRQGGAESAHMRAGRTFDARQQEEDLTSCRAQLGEAQLALDRMVENMRVMQAKLVASSNLASLGQAAAGIAHEIKNPMNFVANFAAVCADLAHDLRGESRAFSSALAPEQATRVQALVGDLITSADKVVEHSGRVDAIVRSMLLQARGRQAEHETFGVNAIAAQYADLAYHGMRAQHQDFNIAVETVFDPEAGDIFAAQQDIARVLLNLLNNAYHAVQERASTSGAAYTPRVVLRTRRAGDHVELRVEDNGPGVDPGLRERIFEPFFTTKGSDTGTGLGLALSRDIVVDTYRGTITVQDTPGGGATFVVSLPVQDAPAA